MDIPRMEEFVNELTNTIRKDIVIQIHRGLIPVTWDGHELRQLLADKFAQAAAMSDSMRDKRSKRRKEYENTCLLNNL